MSDMMLATRIQYIKRIIHHDQVGFIPVVPEWLNMKINVINHIIKMQGKIHTIISPNAGIAFGNIQHPFMIKTTK